ncbi:MAG: O-antigen ligase family protein [Verrucomicrobia bacterium]|nr:O-antigen ligase family protein [Cytophagales bacterium]
MAYIGVVFTALFFGNFTNKIKIVLFAGAFFCFWAMVYSGARTSYILLPIGFVFFAILTARTNVLIGVGVSLFIGAAVLFSPIQHPSLFLIRTAFSPKDDPSYLVRVYNQARIHPWMRTHPFGGGLGSSGLLGAKYAPGTFLADFPPDSELVRTALEKGWIGLVLYLSLLFIGLKTGIDTYYNARLLFTKTVSAALTTSLFIIIIANYPQEVMQMSIYFYFALCMAMLSKMKQIEEKELKDDTIAGN